MADWCRGKIQIRGFNKDVKRFLDDVMLKNENIKMEHVRKDWYKIQSEKEAWYQGFGCIYSHELDVSDCSIDGDISTKWYFDIDMVQKMSEEYSLDIVIVASEYMQGIFQMIRVVNGVVEVNYVGDDKSLQYSMALLDEEINVN